VHFLKFNHFLVFLSIEVSQAVRHLPVEPERAPSARLLFQTRGLAGPLIFRKRATYLEEKNIDISNYGSDQAQKNQHFLTLMTNKQYIGRAHGTQGWQN